MTPNQKLAARLKAVEQPNMTHYPAEATLPFLHSGANDILKDADGKQYYDFGACFGVLALGHNPNFLHDLAYRRYMCGHLVHGMGDVYPSEEKVLLMERLARLTGFPKGSLTISGFEAVEFALKTAELATGRHAFVAFDNAYHGLGYLTMSLTDGLEFSIPFGPRVSAREGYRCPTPRTAGSQRAALGELQHVLHNQTIAAVVVEPVQARGGCYVVGEAFLRGAKELFAIYGTALIFDEIFCGCWRCANTPDDPPFVYQQIGVEPDLVCIGKGMTGGFPISAVYGSEAIMRSWPISQGYALHTTTFVGHPLSCAAANECLAALENPALQERRANRVVDLENVLIDACNSSGRGWQWCGQGLLQGIKMTPVEVERVVAFLLREGIICLPCGHGTVVQFSPPFTLSDAALAHLGQTLTKYLRA